MSRTLKEFMYDAFVKNAEAIDCASMLQVVLDVGRQNDKRPAFVKVGVPDDWIKNITGNPKLRDVYVVCKVDREIWERANSVLVLPG